MESLVLRLELGLLSNPTLSLTPVSGPLLILGPLPRFWPPVSLAPSHLTHILRARKRSGGGKKGRNTWERLCIQGKLHDSRLITREGNGTPLQYSCLENPMDGGAWNAAVHGVTEGRTPLSFHFHFSLSCIGEGNANPLQCSCLENPRDGEAWWAAVYGVTQSRTRLKWLSSSSTAK